MQRSPYDPKIQKWPIIFGLIQLQDFFIPIEFKILPETDNLIEVKIQNKKERSFLNPWFIRRWLVCSVVSGHEINIEFW